MEQSAALTMSDKTQPPTPVATPGPDAAAASSSNQVDLSDSPEHAATAAQSAEPQSPTKAIADGAHRVVERAQQHGFYSGNFEEEVGQVMKGLGSFWGGFKKRSATTFTTLRADLDKTVAQVQEDLKALQTTQVEVVRKDADEWEAEQAAEKEKKRLKEEEAAAAKEAEGPKDKGKGVEEGERQDPDAAAAPRTAATILDRLSTSRNQFQTSLQSAIQSTVAAAKANPAISNPTQFRDQLAENLRLSTARENLQLSLHQAEKLAEEYVKKGGELVKEAERRGESWVKDAEKWVEENVKVVPPAEQTYVPMGFDGEWYSFSTSTPAAAAQNSTTDATPRASMSAALAGSRKEALLRRLCEDKDLLMVDPAGADETQQRRDEFALWIADKWPAAQKEGKEEQLGNVGAIRMALVPEHLSDEQFWQRYLFHHDMIEAADAKRKMLLEASTQENDDFSWDDDDEADEPAQAQSQSATSSASASTTIAKRDDAATPKPSIEAPGASSKAAAAPGSASSAPAGAADAKSGSSEAASAGTAAVPVTTPDTKKASPVPQAGPKIDSVQTSPRGSEESYDLVSRGNSTAAATEEDSDSDWE